MWKIDNGVFDFSTVSFVDHNWATAFILAAMLLLTVNVVLYRRKFILSLQCLFSKRAFSQLSKEGKLFGEGTFLYSELFVLLTLPISLYQLCTYYLGALGENLNYLHFFGILIGAVALFFVLRLIVDFFVFELFDCTENRYDFHIMASSFWLNTALVLFLSAVVFQYTNFKAVYLLALLIISGLFLLKVYKDFIFKSKHVNLFQFFMYFCTLEILPYAVIVKLLLMYGK